MAKHFPTKSHLLWVMMGIPVHEMGLHVHWLTTPDELQNDSLGLSSSHLHALKRNGAFPINRLRNNQKGFESSLMICHNS
ncbi:hypothetical protein Pint_13973 [Pistacia integerrima]|uniref:Uncharacterized protein n=1 Tax=Pistacia integerrima TaxID=434235 RepID=A0ACC0YA85_9ROSI|nr:hypothetical protein Pint_13973 [Pistacia integerrima]